MNKDDLVKTLDLVGKALGPPTMTPIFSHFCFDKHSVCAHNGHLTIQAPCEVKGTFALHGPTLLKMLKGSTAAEVTFTEDEVAVIVKMGKSKLTLPCLTKEAFVATTKATGSTDVALTPELLEGLRLALVTAGRDEAQEKLKGVTLCFVDTAVMVYSCDNDSLTEVTVPQPEHSGLLPEKLLLSNEFCEALLKVYQDTEAKAGKLNLSENQTVALLDNGWRVYEQVKEPADLDHEQLLIDTIGEDPPKCHYGPTELEQSLSQAAVLSDLESTITEVVVKDRKFTLTTHNSIGTFEEELADSKHPDVQATIHASLIVRSIGDSMGIHIAKDFTLLFGNSHLVLISNK